MRAADKELSQAARMALVIKDLTTTGEAVNTLRWGSDNAIALIAELKEENDKLKDDLRYAYTKIIKLSEK